LLDSINRIIVPQDTSIGLIIVENDDKPYTKKTLEEYSVKSKFLIKYYLETNLGISYARNRSVHEARNSDFCCFVDDDQIVKEDWLVELLKCQKEFGADGVSGFTPPKFDFKVPNYIRKYHEEVKLPYGTIVKQAATGCLLIKKKYLDKIDGPFDHRLNFTGGEDFYLTYQISELGGKFYINHDAISYQIIPKDRATIKYIRKRTIRVSNTQLVVRSLINMDFSLSEHIIRAILRFIRGIIVFIPYFIFARDKKLLGLFKIWYSWGVFLYALGRNNKFYQ